jgi:hypothetical protein
MVYMMRSVLFLFSLTPSKLAQEVKPLICIWGSAQFVSRLGPCILTAEFCIFHSPSIRMSGYSTERGQDHFFLHPFKFNDSNHSLTSPSKRHSSGSILKRTVTHPLVLFSHYYGITWWNKRHQPSSLSSQEHGTAVTVCTKCEKLLDCLSNHYVLKQKLHYS